MSKDIKLIKVERPTSGITFMVSPSMVESYRIKGYIIHEPKPQSKQNKSEKIDKPVAKDSVQGSKAKKSGS